MNLDNKPGKAKRARFLCTKCMKKRSVLVHTSKRELELSCKACKKSYWSIVERREEERYEHKVRATLFLDDGSSIDSKILDMSMGGLCLLVPGHDIRRKTMLEVQYTVNKKISIFDKAEVRRISDREIGLQVLSSESHKETRDWWVSEILANKKS